MNPVARYFVTFLLALAAAVALGRWAAIEDGAQSTSDDLADAIHTAKFSAKGKM